MEVIAGIYQIDKKISAGGGKGVFWGRHLVWNKPVVIRVRKGYFAVEEQLRKEAELLKSLRHAYLPQIYDHVEENGIVFTVMEYIPGVSLKRLLEKGYHPLPRSVASWACQIAEALEYLHSRPLHPILHGNVTPANILLRPDGNVCLVGINIPLLFKEDPTACASEQDGSEGFSFVLDSGSAKAFIRPDVGQDIYGLGATMYEMLSGKEPAGKPEAVIPLDKKCCSKAMAALVDKAMSPEVAKRFQSAAEMRLAFLEFQKNDKKLARRRVWRRDAVAAVGFLAVSMALLFVRQHRMHINSAAMEMVVQAQELLAQDRDEAAVKRSLEALQQSGWKNEAVSAAQNVLTAALGVYEVSDEWFVDGEIKLSEKPNRIRLSPEGRYLAVVVKAVLEIYDVQTRELLWSLPMQKTEFSEALFLDEHTVVYAAADGITSYDILAGKRNWVGKKCTHICISKEAGLAAAVNKTAHHAYIYRLEDGKQIKKVSFGGRHFRLPKEDSYLETEYNLFALHPLGTYLAVSDSKGGMYFYALKGEKTKDLDLYKASDYQCFAGAFCENLLVYAASGLHTSEFGMIDLDCKEVLVEYESNNQLQVDADENGIYLAEGNLFVRLDADTREQVGLAQMEDASILDFAVCGNSCVAIAYDGSVHVYEAGKEEACFEGINAVPLCDMSEKNAVVPGMTANSLRVLKKVVCDEAEVFQYDPFYMHEETKLDEKNGTVMLFSDRSFRVYRMDGERLAGVDLPDCEHIYNRQYVRDDAGDNYLEVTWQYGKVKRYSSKDGSLIYEGDIEPPPRDASKIFAMGNYLFESPADGVPCVYRKKGHRLVKEFSEDADLTDVIKVENGFVTEYVTAEGERYGLLLDVDFDVVARMDGLCDAASDGFLYDLGMGSVRKTKQYTLEELVEMAEGKK